LVACMFTKYKTELSAYFVALVCGDFYKFNQTQVSRY